MNIPQIETALELNFDAPPVKPELLVLTEKQRRNFEEKIDKSGGVDACWIWTGARCRDGYGTFWVNNSALGAHRIAWLITRGAIADGLCVCHDCPGGDNPACVNPAHLFLGTHQVNMTDRDSKGRGGSAKGITNGAYTHPDKVLRGESNGMSELSASKVIEMRVLKASSEITYEALGKLFGVSKATACAAVTRRTWAHVP